MKLEKEKDVTDLKDERNKEELDEDAENLVKINQIPEKVHHQYYLS